MKGFNYTVRTKIYEYLTTIPGLKMQEPTRQGKSWHIWTRWDSEANCNSIVFNSVTVCITDNGKKTTHDAADFKNYKEVMTTINEINWIKAIKNKNIKK